MSVLQLLLAVPALAVSGRIYIYNGLQFYGDDYNTIINYNCNFNSQPYSSIPASPDQCGRICLQDSQCSHFTYEIAGNCALRSGLVGLDKPIGTNDIRRCGIYGDYTKSGCSFNTGAVQCQGDPNPNGTPAKPQNTGTPNGNGGATSNGNNGGSGSSNGNSNPQITQGGNTAVAPLPTLTTFVRVSTTIIQQGSLPTESNPAGSAVPTGTLQTGIPLPTSSSSDSNSGDLPFASRILIIIGVALAVIVVLLIPFLYLLNRLSKRKQELIREARAAESNRAIEQRKQRHIPGMSVETAVNSTPNDALPSRLSTVNEVSAEE
ncbi:hypothetical protein HDV01_005368 [Terramyces sp. JEL0728]|nr:hypothetical protein HDV01_005368 [Terramyces sp. JEL0728]